MSIFTKADAILAINPDSKFSYFHPPRDEIKWLSNNISQPTEENIQIEISRLQAEYDAQEYARNRKAEYPDWDMQLDYIFHNGVDKWKEDIVQPVKDKYPKPE